MATATTSLNEVPCELPPTPLPDVRVDLCVEEDEEDEGDDAEDDEPGPVEVDRVVRVHPELRDVEDHLVLGHLWVQELVGGLGAVGLVVQRVGQVAGVVVESRHGRVYAVVVLSDGHVDVGDLEELGHVEEDADDGDWDQVLHDPPLESVGVVRGPAVVDGMVHGHVALEPDGHGHQDGSGHGHHQEWVQEVGEQD